MSWIKRMEACGREGAENPREKLTLIKNALCVSHCMGPGQHWVHTQSLQSCLTLYSPVDCSLQSPLSTGFSRQEYWSGLPCPPPGDLPNPGI